MPRAAKPMFGLVTLGGPVDPHTVEIAAQTLRVHFDCRVRHVVDPVNMARFFHIQPGQYNADPILDYLLLTMPRGCVRVVGITEVDLFAPGYRFLYGYAHRHTGVAVLSTQRFHDPATLPEDLKAARIRKAVLHEAGHGFNLSHCGRGHCLMSPVKWAWDFDPLSDFCSTCAKTIRKNRAGQGSVERASYRGHAAVRVGQREVAIKYFQQAVAGAPTNIHYLCDLGDTYMAAGHLDVARATFQKAVNKNPNTPRPRACLIEVCRLQGDLSAASLYLAHRLNAGRGSAHCRRAGGLVGARSR